MRRIFILIYKFINTYILIV